MDLPTASFSLVITQLAAVRSDLVMAMVEALPAESEAFWSH